MRAALGGVLALALCGAAQALPAAGDPDLACKLGHPSKSVASLKAMPGPLRKFIAAHIGPMADRGEFFNATDVVQRPAPFDRFIRGGEIGERWFLWYEHGGIAYWRAIVLFGSDPSGTPHVIADARAGLKDDLCALTDTLLDRAH